MDSSDSSAPTREQIGTAVDRLMKLRTDYPSLIPRHTREWYAKRPNLLELVAQKEAIVAAHIASAAGVAAGSTAGAARAPPTSMPHVRQMLQEADELHAAEREKKVTEAREEVVSSSGDDGGDDDGSNGSNDGATEAVSASEMRLRRARLTQLLARPGEAARVKKAMRATKDLVDDELEACDLETIEVIAAQSSAAVYGETIAPAITDSIARIAGTVTGRPPAVFSERYRRNTLLQSDLSEAVSAFALRRSVAVRALTMLAFETVGAFFSTVVSVDEVEDKHAAP